jgi:putative ABC transport system permease protein
MIPRLAWSALSRHPLRTALAILGVAVATAMLLDMVMLATGMTVSFRELLGRKGFDVRLAPKGTLPFDTEASIERAGTAESTLLSLRAVRDLSPVLGRTVRVSVGDRTIAAFALGVRADVQGDYEITRGRDVAHSGEMAASASVLEALGAAPGDTVHLVVSTDPALERGTNTSAFVIVAEARFIYLSSDQRAISMPLAALQALDPSARDAVSLFMLRLVPGANGDSVARDIERALPRVTAISTALAVRSLAARLSYFRQLAFILGTVSLVVAFLLVTTIVTVGLNERLGEIAVMRAIGVRRSRVVQQVALETIGLAIGGVVLGIPLGLLTADLLNTILRDFPGLPESIDFFVFDSADVWQSLGLVVLSAVCAVVPPAFRAASLPIAATLRAEAV